MTQLLSAGGTALGLVASQQQAQGELPVGQSQQQVSDYNAQVETQRAATATNQAAAQAAIDATATTRKLGTIQADYGAAGVVGTTGSPLSVMMDQSMQGELARQLDLYRGSVTAQTDAQSAKLDYAQGIIANQAAGVRAQGTLLTGATKALGSSTVGTLATSAGNWLGSLFGGGAATANAYQASMAPAAAGAAAGASMSPTALGSLF
jgi:hypothetical protein